MENPNLLKLEPLQALRIQNYLQKQISPARRNTVVKQSRNSAHKKQMSEIEKYSDTCADTEGKYLQDASRKCPKSYKFSSNGTNNLRDSFGKENCNESVLNHV